MTVYGEPEGVSPGETTSASKFNKVVAAIKAIWKGAAAGDMEYYSSSTEKTKVSIGNIGQVWKVLASGVLGWGSGGIQIGISSDTDIDYGPYSSQAWGNVPGADITMNLAAESTVIAFYVGRMRTSYDGYTQFYSRIDIGASEGNQVIAAISGTGANHMPFTAVNIQPNVPAGSITIQGKFYSEDGNNGYINDAIAFAIAIPE